MIINPGTRTKQHENVSNKINIFIKKLKKSFEQKEDYYNGFVKKGLKELTGGDDFEKVLLEKIKKKFVKKYQIVLSKRLILITMSKVLKKQPITKYILVQKALEEG